MRRHISVFLISFVLLKLIFFVACQSEEEISLHILGTVTDRDSDFPIAEVVVDLFSEGVGSKKVTRTDEEGFYEINYYGVCYGGFQIRAYKMDILFRKNLSNVRLKLKRLTFNS